MAMWTKRRTKTDACEPKSKEFRLPYSVRMYGSAISMNVEIYFCGQRELLQYADFQEAQEALSPDQPKLLALEVM
jgi:hypothetical protein